MSQKLYVISRDGKAINDFIEIHGMSKSDIITVKLVSDLDNAIEGDRYVVLPPFPIAFQWSFRPILNEKKLVNVTRYYNRLQALL